MKGLLPLGTQKNQGLPCRSSISNDLIPGASLIVVVHLNKTLLLSILRFFSYQPGWPGLQPIVSLSPRGNQPCAYLSFSSPSVPLRATGMQRESGGGVGSPNRTSGKRILGIFARNKVEISALKSWEWCVLGQGCDWTAESIAERKAKVKELGRGEKLFLHPPQCTFSQAQKQGAALAWGGSICVKSDANRCWTQEALYPKSAH